MEQRYSRQILFSGIGPEGQEKLGSSRVLLVGCGALGSVLAEIVVRAGVGRLTLADRDYVDESNLQRQSLYTEADCREGLPKAVAAGRRLRAMNSGVEVVEKVLDVDARSIADILPGSDLVLDGTDNFETRYLINDASIKWNVPWVYGACVGAYGICLTILPGRTPCLRCVLETMPPPGSSPTCDTAGIIGPIVHAVAALQAAEALKILAGKLGKVSRKLVTLDLWENRISATDLGKLQADPRCPACGLRKFEYLSGEHESRPQVLCGRNSVQVRRTAGAAVEFESIARRLERSGRVSFNEHLLRAELDGIEIALFRDGRGIVKGTSDVEEARRLYSKYIGN